MKDATVSFVLKNYRCFPDDEPARFTLGDDFTAFIGPNNVGKSTLLRFAHEMRGVFGGQENAMVGAVLGTGSYSTRSYGPFGDLDPTAVFSMTNDRPMTVEVAISVPDGVARAHVPDLVRISIERDLSALTEVLWKGRPVAGTPGSQELLVETSEGPFDVRPYVQLFAMLGLHSIYVPSFRHAINTPGGSYYDMVVGHSFVEAWRDMTQGDDARQRQAARALEREIRDVFGFDDLAISPHANGRTLHVRINEETFRLEEVGAGIAHFIICLTYVATRKPQLVFIDEPESNLHPTLQVALLEGIARRVSHGVVFASHSIGLVRSVGARAYSLRPIRHGVAEVTDFDDPRTYAEQLGELSFSAYQEVGFSKLLLVEGSTETLAVRALLRKYGKDKDVVLLSLGGADTIRAEVEQQLAELKRICGNVSALIDSERAEEGAALDAPRQAFVDACRALDVKVHVLDRRAFENYLTDEAIRRAVGESRRGLGPFELLKDLSGRGWKKSDNWRIANEMTREDLADSDLGTFLEAL